MYLDFFMAGHLVGLANYFRLAGQLSQEILLSLSTTPVLGLESTCHYAWQFT